MDRIVSRARCCAGNQPHYPVGGRGQAAIALERMLHIYFLQEWFSRATGQWKMRSKDSRAMEAFEVKF